MSGRGLDNALPLWVITPPPQRPSLRSGLYCPSPSSLNRPHPPHSQGASQFHRMAAYTRCLRCAGAPRRPTSGSGLSLFIPSWHAVLSDPGEFDIDIQKFDADIGLRRMTTGSALPTLPQSVPRGRSISWLHWFASATACQVACPPCTDQTGILPQPPGTLLPGFQRIGLPPRCWI